MMRVDRLMFDEVEVGCWKLEEDDGCWMKDVKGGVWRR